MAVDSYGEIKSKQEVSTEVLVRSLEQPKSKRQSAQFDSESLVNAAADSVAISASGQKINELYAELNKIEDQDDRESARSGFRKVLSSFAKGADAGSLTNVYQELSELKDRDAETFQHFFKTADKVEESGADLGSYVDTFVKIEDSEFQKKYIAETDEIVTNSEATRAERGRTADEFFHTVGEAISNGRDEKEIESNMDELFNRLAGKEKLSDKAAEMNELRQEFRSEASPGVDES